MKSGGWPNTKRGMTSWTRGEVGHQAGPRTAIIIKDQLSAFFLRVHTAILIVSSCTSVGKMKTPIGYYPPEGAKRFLASGSRVHFLEEAT